MSMLDDVLRDLVVANRILSNEDIVDAYGHISVRHPDNPKHFFMSRSRAPELVERHDLIEFDQEGEPVCASSVPLLGSLGIGVPLYPLKGYSLTAPLDGGRVAAPRISITDYERKVVYARLGERLRIAGMADIGGRQPDMNAGRIATLRAAAKAMFPGVADFDKAVAWCGLRPATPKGLPIIDRTPFENLWLNIGHGALGFTLALASGRLIGDLVSRRKPAISVRGFALADT